MIKKLFLLIFFKNTLFCYSENRNLSEINSAIKQLLFFNNTTTINNATISTTLNTTITLLKTTIIESTTIETKSTITVNNRQIISKTTAKVPISITNTKILRTFKNNSTILKTTSKTSITTKSQKTTKKKDIEDYGDYNNAITYTFEEWSPKVYQQIKYGVIFIISFVAVIIQLYASIGGRRMRLHSFRWITIHLSAWNICQLLLFANYSIYTPWMDYLKSSSIKNNKISLEQMTLSIFPTVIIFLTPILIIQYFRKSCVNSKFFNWIIWIPILVLLNILPVLLYCSYEWKLEKNEASRNNTSLIEFFSFFTFLFAYLTLFYLFIVEIIAIICFIIFLIYKQKLTNMNIIERFYRLLDFFLYFLFVLIILYLHTPIVCVNLASFAFNQLVPLFLKNKIPTKIPQIVLTIMEGKEFTELIIPLAQVILTGICVQSYREQYLSLLTCNRIYTNSADGAIKILWFKTVKSKQDANLVMPKK